MINKEDFNGEISKMEDLLSDLEILNFSDLSLNSEVVFKIFEKYGFDGRIFKDAESAFDWQTEDMTIAQLLSVMEDNQFDLKTLNNADDFKNWYINNHQNFISLEINNKKVIVYFYELY